MSTINERTVARGRRLDPDRDITQDAADFYLLENLANVRGDALACELLDRHERTLANEFAGYLDMAIGGELRYAKRYLEELPPELEPFFREVSDTARGKAWLVWTVIRRKFGLDALDLAEEAFGNPGWRRNFGGYPWACAVRALRPYLEGKRKPRLFVDQCFNLQHNTGCILNKLYNVSKLPEVLEAHGADDYPVLLHHASVDVRRRWRRQDYLQRADHDPTWLGVQILDSYDDVA
ncbi:MAG: hypothetical protein WEB06_08140 [Actinomycetota bacterium]